MLEKTYDPASLEAAQYAKWEAAGAFAHGRRRDAKPYTIVIPPPNVTGVLHVGHALNNALQDVLIRWQRMKGRDTLWQPGMDHAGIATQMMVERQLRAEGASRMGLGREAFVERVWRWKAESGGAIIGQLHRLGASCDWSRERFTLDDGLSRAVTKVFIDLHRQGLIYKDKRLVNWDPVLLTAISDLEVQPREVQGHLWHLRYPVEGEGEGEGGRVIIVATTRPETMLGDTAVAVHPDDARYADLIGRFAILPLVGRRIPIVADAYADPEQGSGAVKITPAHDFNDFEVGRRHGLEAITIFDERAHLNDAVPAPYRGLGRFEARKRIVADLEAQGLVEKIEPHTHVVPYGDRSDAVIEPWLTDQWYVDAKTLAEPAIRAVEEGRTRFFPANWAKTYFEWMRNIQPWCISRQLWWGHRIPAWYGPDGHVFVAENEAAAARLARAHYGEARPLTRDEDVLDTWFSSALWPFSTLGWPDETPELARHYPTDTLVTSFDIIFFWVARMMMMGLHFRGDVPFRDVYIHALVRDEKGQKMSKTKGNVIDPLALMDKYGADALRFTLIAMAAMGRDIRLAEQRVAGYRNFATKLWNAARFCEMNACRPDPAFDPRACRHSLNRWIVGAAGEATHAVDSALSAYKFDQAAGAVYQFVWHTYCDWYLELAKPILAGEDAQAAAETKAAAAWALGTILKLLHPFMPFVTEALWEQFGDGSLLIEAPWPEADTMPADAGAAKEVAWVIALVSEIRAIRAELNVPARARITAYLRDAGDGVAAHTALHGAQIRALARLDDIVIGAPEAVAKGAVQTVVDGVTLLLPLAGVIDLEQERTRLKREIEKLEGDIAKIDRKLGNAAFLAKAPAAVVREQHERRDSALAARGKLEAALARIDIA